jgi:HPt (histidine-containing phosphotransfer) domain-containing protein
MASSKPGTPAVATFKDHEVITPPNKLEGVAGGALDGDDPVARAEAALAQLSSEFSDWMDDECEQLDRARRNVRQAGMAAQQREALFRAAHDIKGQAATLGFPLVAAVAESLCLLIDETNDPRRIPLALIDQHVDAVRAIIREHSRPQAEAVASKLTRTLRAVCDDFLRREGKDAVASDAAMK